MIDLRLPRIGLLAILTILSLLVAALYVFEEQRRSPSTPTLQNLKLDIKRDWTPLGGSWRGDGDAIVNDSEERGAKLMYGHTSWHNYFVEADVQLLGSSGDAGLIIRGDGEEVGVDAYHGYFAGIRDKDDVAILGRADFGWDQYAAVPMPSPVEVGHWYHITLIAVDCRIAFSVVGETGHVTRILAEDSACLTSGRIGLKSYSSAARWRNITIGAADGTMLDKVSEHIDPVVVTAERNPSALGFTDKALDRYMGPIRREARKQHFNQGARPIASLRHLDPDLQTSVIIQGVVTITYPAIYIQDSTGSVEIQASSLSVPVKVGDEVDVRGLLAFKNYTPMLKQADFQVLWTNVPLSPLAARAFALAAGGHDGELVELPGILVSRSNRPDGTTQLTFSDDTQRFYVMAESSTIESQLKGIPLGSRLMARGVVSYSPEFTLNIVPFALLLPSSASMELIKLPSWWSPFHIAITAACCLLMILGLQLLLIRIQRWRLRSVLKERERLALDMHDTLAQSFAGIRYQLQAVRNETSLPEPSRQHVEVAIAMVQSSHEEAKRSISALRPEYLGNADLIEVLCQYAHRAVYERSIKIISKVQGRSFTIPLPLADAMLRIGQEAISNAVRHADPESILISLMFQGERVIMILQDDGNGFVVDHNHVGFGIRGMEKRARNANAQLQVSSSSAGTTVCVTATIASRWTMFQRIETILDFIGGA